MAQGVNRCCFLNTTRLHGLLHCFLHATGIHRFLDHRPTLSRFRLPRKKQSGMPVLLPVVAQQFQRRLWQRHIAIFGTFALANRDEFPATINIGNS